MSRIAAPGVSRSMIIPGGMIAPPTSCALNRRLTKLAGAIMPISSAIVDVPATAAICAVVTSLAGVVPP